MYSVEEKMSFDSTVLIEKIRAHYYHLNRQTLRIDDARYYLEKAQELGLLNREDWVEELFNRIANKIA